MFIDLSITFDTLNLEILLDKLSYYGIRSTANSLIRCYLTNRQHIVEYENALAFPLTVKSRVPQGFILWPLYFFIYINNLPNFPKILD